VTNYIFNTLLKQKLLSSSKNCLESIVAAGEKNWSEAWQLPKYKLQMSEGRVNAIEQKLLREGSGCWREKLVRCMAVAKIQSPEDTILIPNCSKINMN